MRAQETETITDGTEYNHKGIILRINFDRVQMDDVPVGADSDADLRTHSCIALA